MQAVILRCRPNSQFHFGNFAFFGETFLDYASEIPHSDTLFSALVNIYDTVYAENKNDTDIFVELFNQRKIKISSGMFCIEHQGKMIYFLPKPIECNLAKSDNHKKLKKIAYISKGVWETGVSPNRWDTDCLIIDSKFVCLKNELAGFESLETVKLFEKDSLPKVKVHSDSQDDSFYHQTNLTIADNSEIGIQLHYYFLYETDLDNKMQKRFETTIRVLADTGLGGQRSTGCGLFDSVEFVTDFKFRTTNTQKHCALSLISPSKTNADLDKAIYFQLIIRGGKNKTNIVRMLAEGAVVKPDICGQIVDISKQKDKSVLRFGLNFSIPIHSNLLIL